MVVHIINMMKKIKIDKISLNKIIIFICILIYLIYCIIYRITGDQISTMIILGTDYKTFTLGLGDYFRLITSGFCHFSIIHLLGNMISLYSLGTFIEIVYGRKRYLLYLFIGILLGSLTSGTLNTNIIESGISSALYTFLVIIILYLIVNQNGLPSNFTSILLINAGLNFLPNVSWQAHLGGAIAGVMLFFINYYEQNNNRIYNIFLKLLLVITLCFISYKYYNTKNEIINYPGTDQQYIEYLEKYAPFLKDYYENKIYNYYDKKGK